jgi:hypothetical protein
MAEHVQEALDQMVAPMRDLMDREIFTQEEVHAIISRRRESEYLLRRRAARKADFLRYIQAEMNLEKLRKLRTLQKKRDTLNKPKQDGDDDDGGKRKEEKHIGDTHIIQHIHLLFVRAIRKFRSDLSLHLAHADFCKEQKSFTRLGRVYAEALQIFPRQDGLWIEAASHEFFGPTRSIRNARVLLQRALRINQTSQELWLEYFSLELHYAQTLKGRRQILQGGKPDDGTVDRVDEIKIPMIVYKNAVQSIPDNVSFRLRFLDACTRFPNTEPITEAIQESLRRDFASSPEAWIARALYAAQKQALPEGERTHMEQQATKSDDESSSDSGDSSSDSDSDDDERPAKRAKPLSSEPVLAILEQALDTVPSDEMHVQAFRFARSYQSQLENDEEKDHQEALVMVKKFIQGLFDTKAEDCSSSELILELVNYLTETSRQRKKPITMLQKFCTENKASFEVWVKWASMERKNTMPVLKLSLSKIAMSEPDHLRLLLQYLGAQMLLNDEKEFIWQTFQRILLLQAGKEDTTMDMPEIVQEFAFGVASVADACTKLLQYYQKDGLLESARRVYTKVLFQSNVLKSTDPNIEEWKNFVDLCISFERKDKVRLVRLYDQVLDRFRDTVLEEHYQQEKDEAIYSN